MPLLLIGAAPVQDPDWSDAIAEWTTPMEPFRIAGNVHYVGTGGISAYLITGPEGHVLIDGALPQSAGAIAAHIRALGFRVEDVRYILINHAHFDHSGGLAELKRLTGAKLLASAADKPDLEAGRTIGRDDLLGFPAVAVDRVIADGEHVRLAGIDLTVHATPGHTPGCTSWSMRVAEGGRPLDVVFTCSITVAGQKLVGNAGYPDAADDFRRSFATLRRLRADIFLSFHPTVFGMEEKRRRLLAGDPLAFVDAKELGRVVDAAEAGFKKELAEQRAKAAEASAPARR
ncbi:subclass B3 metallo-beta-lactamase [Sphingomonas canadensis]|uniref:Subclass B3 metallo-beta-lactamase n=2 Tax=Sphingomonas canadensis TaxID=1219257 RepID=A0ABW3H9A9_9SPHN|nr:subclass B3 metallo-beta-lactamase [Sphingomonas canadensis]